MSPPFDGGCRCGAVRYRVGAAPLTLYACHCTDCQRYNGSAFGMTMILAREALTVLRGTPATFVEPMRRGGDCHQVFCGVCATRLWASGPDAPIAALRPGTLDDTRWLRPVAHVWTRSAQPWLTLPDDVLRYETQPDDLAPLLDAWAAAQA